ncbi:hypothetical protein H0H92_005112 [Tricholoma furcatifolium]|nr:hypothetical protein H0H92_005112 [Tricholoma furcatifolium]
MLFGRRPRGPCTLRVGDRTVKDVTKYKYVGIWFTAASPFKEHYAAKAAKARKVGGVVFAMQASVGTIPPHAGRILYMARVDPHLIFGCEVALGTVEVNIRSLESVQVAYCRHLLGLGPRRAILALRSLMYVLELPVTNYAALASRDSLQLAAHDKRSWAGDFIKVLRQLQCAGADDGACQSGTDTVRGRSPGHGGHVAATASLAFTSAFAEEGPGAPTLPLHPHPCTPGRSHKTDVLESWARSRKVETPRDSPRMAAMQVL